MKRVQVQFTDELVRALEEEAAASGRPVAEIVRQAVASMLAQDERHRRWDRAVAAIGAGHSGLHDVAENHDAYLNEGDRW